MAGGSEDWHRRHATAKHIGTCTSNGLILRVNMETVPRNTRQPLQYYAGHRCVTLPLLGR